MKKRIDEDALQAMQAKPLKDVIPVRKLGPRGVALLAQMRATHENNLEDLGSRLQTMYAQLDLNEIRSACDRPSSSLARNYVARAYRALTDSVRFSSGFSAQPIYTVKLPSTVEDPGVVAHLVGLVVDTNVMWRDMTTALLDSLATEATDRVKAQITNLGLDGFSFRFEGKDSTWFSPGFPENVKLHVIFDLYAREIGVSNFTGSVWSRLGMNPVVAGMLDTHVDAPGDNELNARFLVLGIAVNAHGQKHADLLRPCVLLDNVLARVKHAVIDHEFRMGSSVKISNVALFSDAYDGYISSERHSNFKRIVQTAIDRAGTDKCLICAAWLKLPDTERFYEELRIGVWRESGAFVYGTSWVVSAMDSKSALMDALNSLSADVGLSLTVLAEVSDERATGQRNARLYPNVKGVWLDPDIQVAGEGAALIKSVHWRGFCEPTSGTLRSVPFPIYAERIGMVDAMQQHYQPKVYARIKELFANTALSDEDIFRQLDKDFPVAFEALMRNAPHAALPTMEVLLALRYYWSKSPLMVVKNTLQERLLNTDISPDIPIGLIATPFPMCYFHFEDTSLSPSWMIDGQEMSCLGFFAHEHTTGHYIKTAVRVIEFGFIAASEDGQSLLLDDFTLEFLSLEDTISEALRRTLADEPSTNDQEREVFLQLTEIAIKLFLYLGSPGACQVLHEPRKALLATLKGKSEGQRQKIQQTLSNTYDYIVVGPKESFEFEAGTGSRAAVTPHMRRGHGRNVSFGKGRLEKRFTLFPPVLVNKHLLGQDPSSWPGAKNYKLK